MEPGKVFVGGISWDTNEKRLREYFQSFGEVIEAMIMKDRNTGRARGFGFVVFADASVAERVVREKHMIDGRTVEAKKAVPREDQTVMNRSTGTVQGSPGLLRTKKIFVGGLASTVTESEFKNYFDQFGTITDVVVMYDHSTQRPRGFGFITYDSEDAVEKALVKVFHELNGKKVEVKRAVPKELSPNSNRNQLGGYNNNYSPSRFSSFLNAYVQGYNLNSLGGYGMRMDGRFSPITVGHSSGYLPLGPSGFGMGLSFEPGLNPSFEGSGNIRSNIGYASGLNTFYNVSQNRYINPIGYGRGSSGRNGSVLSSPSRNMWGNGGLNYSSTSANSNDITGAAASGYSGALWGSSNTSDQGGASISAYSGGNMSNGRNSGHNITAASSFAELSDRVDGPFGNFSGVSSFYGDPTWRSSSLELEGTGSFGFGSGKMGADILATNSPGYVDAYTVTDRANRGIAA